MDEQLVVETVELEEVVPCERPPQCTREAFLNPPDWRYRQAVQFLEDERNGRASTVPTDPLVHIAIRSLRAFRQPGNRQFLDQLWPNVSEALRLGTVMRNSALVAELESHIIAGHTAEQLKHTTCMIPKAIYNLYKELFLDLSGIIAVHSWVNDFLFEPLKHNGCNIQLRSRILAYYGSYNFGMKVAVTGMESKEAENMLRQIMQTDRQKAIFDYVIAASDMDKMDYALLMEAALKSMTERDFQEHMRDRLEAGSDSLVDLAANIAEGVRAFSQSEMEHFNQNGVDPVNGYTSIICNERAQEDGR